jgi:hypothetical protein
MLTFVSWLLKTALAALLLLIATVLIGRERFWLVVVGQPDLGVYDFAQANRSPTPNDALACSGELCVEVRDIALLTARQAPEAVFGLIETSIAATSPRFRRADDRADPFYRRYITFLPRLGFPDTTDIRLEPIKGRQGEYDILAYARAQIGRADFGANHARLLNWLAPWVDGASEKGKAPADQ